MRTRLLFVLLLLGAAACAASADEVFRDDFDSVTAWEARPDYLAEHTDHPVAVSEGGVARFAVAEPGKGMKWLRQLEEPVDFELTPWLVLRYRAVNFNPQADYLLWLYDRGHTEGVRFKAGQQFPVDGQWHTVALDLTALNVVPPITQMALQCLTNQEGQAALYVDYVAITDTPPADAEGVQAPVGEGKEWRVALDDPAQWIAQPSWLANYTDKSGCRSNGADGLIFSVAEGARGVKWSHQLPEPIEGAQWVAMRYRGRNLQSSSDYALYIASTGGGKADSEQYVIRQSDLLADGAWHVAIARVAVAAIKTLAAQVQARRDDASMEIASLRFLQNKPQISLADTFESTPGWPKDMAQWRPVDLPAANTTAQDLARRLGATGWIPTGQITVGGVPFTIRAEAQAAIMTPLRDPGEIAVPLRNKAAEAYLILAAQFPTNDEPSYNDSAGMVRQVHRFVASLQYADGTAEEEMPYALASQQHGIARGLAAYALALDPARALKSITLSDRMDRGAFGLVAMTLSGKPGPASEATALKAAVNPPAEKPVAARAAGLSQKGSLLAAEAFSISLGLDTSKGLRVVSLVSHSGVGLACSLQSGPLFRVIGPDFEINSEQFAVTKVEREEKAPRQPLRIDLTCDQVTPPIGVSVWVDVADPREIGLQGRINLNGHDPAKVRFIFPEVGGIRFGNAPQNLWVWCPRRGSIITAENVNLREPYAGGGNPLQIIGAFDPRQGTGLYLLTQDLEAQPRYYQVQKSDTGARLAVEYTPLQDVGVTPQGTMTPRALIGCNQGDWHEQLARYREWAGTWYQPAAPRKPWFRDIFSFRQQFLSFGVPTRSGMFDEKTKTLAMKQVLDADAKAFGGLDYLHLFDWGWDPVHGRCGDYVPWDYLGGADNFARAVAEVQDAGTPVGLYLEGILVDPQSDLGKAHGQEWQLLNAEGKPYDYFAPSYDMCARVPAWQDYLSSTYGRVRKETGAKGFYIDEYGFSTPSHMCYNPAHGHPLPVTPVLGERGMLKKVRAQVGPEAAIYTEESPTDVNSQYQDGSFTYSISSVSDAFSPSHVNLYRFAFPDFKTIEIIVCDQPLGTNVEAVKRILFNGEAIWIEGIADKWFSPDVKAQIALNHRLMRENKQCFVSDHVTPLVPTLLEGVYANQFSERADVLGKTCWTVYNTHYRTIRGEVLAVDHEPGCQYLDEMTGKPLKPRIVGKKAYLRLEMSPRDVVVISRGLYVK